MVEKINNISKTCFYCNVDNKTLDVVEFYKQDINILHDIADEVIIATRWRDIDWKSDIIFVWWWTYAFIPVFIGKILRKRVIITGTFNIGDKKNNRDYDNRKFLQRMLIKYSLTHAWKNILVSKKEHSLIRERWKLDNLEYSPHIVDIEKYSYSSKRIKNLLFTICWMEKENVYRKCIREIVNSIRIISERGLNIKLIIAGHSGGAENDVIDLIKEQKLDRYVEFVGEIDERNKVKLLQECSIYLQPSRYEGFGLAIAEAMSCGSAIISSDTGEVRNVVGDSGIILNNCDEKNISIAITSLLANPQKILEFGKSARDRIVNNFSYERRLEDFKRILKGELNETNNPIL
ncbi:MAG: glycosyltransferase family 4 protein [Candidatus Marinimicrobia bacterium]|nr:glycosyltransferase family 4 protein [Candidatus Neomarinimicrobiota bacterium]